MTFEIVEMVKTKDGSLFDCESKAEAYITDAMCADINEIIKTLDLFDLKHSDLCKIIHVLAGTRKNAQNLLTVLSRHI
jgi:hypothetical protein